MNNTEKAFALETARSAAGLFVKDGRKFKPENAPKSFNEKRGCFVTLTEGGESCGVSARGCAASVAHKGATLRGCIGYPEPIMPLIDALVDSAINACRDPRFPPLDAS